MNPRIRLLIFLALLPTVSVMLCHCQSKPEPPRLPPTKGGTQDSASLSEADSEHDIQVAHIDSAQVLAPPGQPPTLRITGFLRDGATQIHQISQQLVGGEISVTVTTTRPNDAVASPALIPFERTVPLDLRFIHSRPLPSVTVNGVRAVEK